MKTFIELILYSIIGFVFGYSTQVLAKNQYADFTVLDNEIVSLTPSAFRKKLEIVGEVYVVDSNNGRFIGKLSESRIWKFGNKKTPIVANWSFTHERVAGFHILQTWQIDPQGQLIGTLKQYDDMKRADKKIAYGKLISNETIKIKNFAPYSKKVATGNGMDLIIRLSFNLKENIKSEDLDMPISGKEVMMVDSLGTVWSPDFQVTAKYITIVTHQGAVTISFKKFPGASEMGVARGNKLSLNLPNKTVKLIAANDFVPGEVRGKIYGIYNPVRKTAKIGSTMIMATDDGDEVKDIL